MTWPGWCSRTVSTSVSNGLVHVVRFQPELPSRAVPDSDSTPALTHTASTPATTRDPTLTVDKNGHRHFSQMAWINKRPTTSITAQVTPWIENACDFDPPDPRMIDMSPKGMMASTNKAMPTDRLSAVSIIV